MSEDDGEDVLPVRFIVHTMAVFDGKMLSSRPSTRRRSANALRCTVNSDLAYDIVVFDGCGVTYQTLIAQKGVGRAGNSESGGD